MQRLLGLSEGVVDRYEQNTDRYEHKKRIPRDCDCPEITTAACSYLSTHTLLSLLRVLVWAAVVKRHGLSGLQTTDIYLSQLWKLKSKMGPACPGSEEDLLPRGRLPSSRRVFT